MICSQIGVKSDVWSLGCILYYLVYGKTPFQHITNSLGKIRAIIEESVVIKFPPIDNPDLLDTLQVNIVTFNNYFASLFNDLGYCSHHFIYAGFFQLPITERKWPPNVFRNILLICIITRAIALILCSDFEAFSVFKCRVRLVINSFKWNTR